MPGSWGCCCRAWCHTRSCGEGQRDSPWSVLCLRRRTGCVNAWASLVCSIPCPKGLLRRWHPARGELQAPSASLGKPWMGTSSTPALQKPPHLCKETKAVLPRLPLPSPALSGAVFLLWLCLAHGLSSGGRGIAAVLPSARAGHCQGAHLSCGSPGITQSLA